MRARREGFTLVELLVVVSIIALLISILLPSLKKARDNAKLTLCMGHLRELGMGYHYYSEDNRQQPPPNRKFGGTPPEYRDSDWWYYNHMVPKFIPSDKKSGTNAAFGGVFECPSDPEAGRAYSMNVFASNVDYPSNRALNTEYVPEKVPPERLPPGMNPSLAFNPVTVRNPHLYLLFGEAHALFADTNFPGKYGARYIIGQGGSSVFRKFMTVEERRGETPFYGYINWARHRKRATMALCDLHVEVFDRADVVRPSPTNPGRWISTLKVRWSPKDEYYNIASPPPPVW